jgi:ribose transport system ATP-binding protein
MLEQSHNQGESTRLDIASAGAASAEACPPGRIMLSVRGLSKAYPGVQALDGVDLDVGAGEIHGIVGQNGAGKSTLIRMLAGATVPDSGTITVEGQLVRARTPIDAQRAGIFAIYQELSLIPELSVAENIFIGDMPKGPFGTVSWSRMRSEAQDAIDWLGFTIDADRSVRSLTVAQRQAVELAKALHRQARVVLLDEPSATLPHPDVKRLFAVMRTLKERGFTLLYISHRMEEVFEICDRVTVFRDGRKTGTYEVKDTTPTEIVRAMIGREMRASILGDSVAEQKPRLGSGGTDEVVLSVRGLSDGKAVHDVSFDLHRGEILGISGLIGNGQPELAGCLFGSRPVESGEVRVFGKLRTGNSPVGAISAGIGLLPEDRKTQGLVMGMNLSSNITMASHGKFSRLSVISGARERRVSEDMVRSLSIKATSVDQPVGTLSGGNQQKVVLAKWLISNSRILIFSEPTRGVDVGAKEEMYELIAKYAREGGSVILISSELPEVVMCDRVLVMVRGRLVGNLDNAQIDARADAILNLCR